MNERRSSHFLDGIALSLKAFIAGMTQTLKNFFKESGQKILRTSRFVFWLINENAKNDDKALKIKM